MFEAKVAEIQSLVSQLKAAGENAHLKSRADPSIVPWMEDSFQLRFPPAMREFFLAFEYLEAGGNEFLRLEEMGDAFRRWRKPCRLPRTHLPILEDGGGGCYFVVCAKLGKKRDSVEFGNILYFDHDAGSLGFKNGDLLNFVIGELRNVLEMMA